MRRVLGKFYGHVVTEWLDDGQNMRLVRDYKYRDSCGIEWHAKRGDVVNGASIPWPFWRVIGSPLTGKYRRASVLHDVACVARSRSWQATHRMLHEAMLAEGCEPWKAAVMFYAVWYFGPRW